MKPAGTGDGSHDRSALAPVLRRLVLAWIALLLLLAASWLISAHSHRFELINASVGIAAIKILIVAWFFMSLDRSTDRVRVAALAGLCAFAILVALSGFDALTRPAAPAPYQTPAVAGITSSPSSRSGSATSSPDRR